MTKLSCACKLWSRVTSKRNRHSNYADVAQCVLGPTLGISIVGIFLAVLVLI
jgi:hypothetical protein